MDEIEDLEVEIAQLEDENATLLRQRNAWRRLAEDAVAVIRDRENARPQAIIKVIETANQLAKN